MAILLPLETVAKEHSIATTAKFKTIDTKNTSTAYVVMYKVIT